MRKIIEGKRRNTGKYVRKRKKENKIDEGSKADKNTEAGVGDIN